MLHVAIDLTSLPRFKGGVGFYLLELISALQRLDSGERYFLIATRERMRELHASNGRFDIVPVDLRTRPVRLAWEQIGLPGLVRRLGVDVLHSPHYTRPLRRLSCASVVGVMDMTFKLMPQYHLLAKRAFFRVAIQASIRRADRFLAISESTSRDMQRCLGIPGECIDVTPLAVSKAYRPDVDAKLVDAARQRYRLPDQYLLFVGRLEPRKNLPRLLDAYAALSQKDPSVPVLVLAGARGWHSAALDTRLARLGKRVHLLGYVPEKDLPAVYRGALLFVYPSLYEGFGIPVLEALSCGVPTITSNVSSMPEVAGDAAELVDPVQTIALERAIERLLHDEGRRSELRVKGVRRASQFSWERTARLTTASYYRAFEQWQRRRH
jgi:glycosyltransferase involved in cell wall biosynthesis